MLFTQQTPRSADALVLPSASGDRNYIPWAAAKHQVPQRNGSDSAQYYDLPPSDHRHLSSSPPRFERSVLTRLHEVRPPPPDPAETCRVPCSASFARAAAARKTPYDTYIISV